MGTFYVQSERVDFTIFLLGVAMGSIACSILILNNIRDLDNDANSGKRTLSVRIGRRNSERLYTLLIAIACAIFFLIPSIPWNFLLLIAAPLLMKITRARSKGEMIKSLELTGKFQLAYASLLALALLLA
jgi:1,4-dihydroxy-2-naphthoate octaprenyltransferase